jgi:transcriptional regulator with XRE-family HTH domain
MLRWARERARVGLEDLAVRFKKLPEWEEGEALPTLKQLEAFAKAVHVPIGYLFLPSPPEEALPVPDFRTFDNREVVQPSPNLLDTLPPHHG